jgi:hypothetical protein
MAQARAEDLTAPLTAPCLLPACSLLAPPCSLCLLLYAGERAGRQGSRQANLAGMDVRGAGSNDR